MLWRLVSAVRIHIPVTACEGKKSKFTVELPRKGTWKIYCVQGTLWDFCLFRERKIVCGQMTRKSTVKRVLKRSVQLWKINLENIALNKISHSSEHHCCEASSEKSLYTENSCSLSNKQTNKINKQNPIHNIYFDILNMKKIDSASEYIWGLQRQDWNSIKPLLYAFKHFQDKHFNQ